MFAPRWHPSFLLFVGKWFSEHINSRLSTLSWGSSRQEVCDTGPHCSQTWPMAMWVTRTSDCLFVCLSICWATINNHGSICFHWTDIEVKVAWFGKLFETLVCDICNNDTIIVFLAANPVMLLYMHHCSLSCFLSSPQAQIDPNSGNGVSVYASVCTALEVLTFLLISLVSATSTRTRVSLPAKLMHYLYVITSIASSCCSGWVQVTQSRSAALYDV